MRNEEGAGDILYYVTVRYLLPLVVVVLWSCSTAPKSEPLEPPAAPTDTKAANPADNRHRLVVFGDSLTAGFGAPPGASFPDYLQKLIDAKHRPWRVINFGVSGDTSTDGVARLPGVLDEKPEMVILELGANDGLRGIPVSATRANLEQIIQGLRDGGAKVVLAGMTLPPNYGPDYIQPFERVFTGLVAQYQLTLIPFLLQGVGGNAALMQGDQLHPTAEGNRRVAENVMRVIDPLLLP